MKTWRTVDLEHLNLESPVPRLIQQFPRPIEMLESKFIALYAEIYRLKVLKGLPTLKAEQPIHASLFQALCPVHEEHYSANLWLAC